MTLHRLTTFVGALLCLAIAALALYRLLFWFPISIGGHEVGQTSSFFAFVIFAALSLILFRGGSRAAD